MSALDFKRTRSTTVVQSPAGAVEVIIAQTPGIQVFEGDQVDVEASCDVIIGTGGVTATLRIRSGVTAGSPLLATFGPFTVVAANRVNLTANAFVQRLKEGYNQVYNLTLQIGSATAPSTVNGVFIGAMY